MGQGREVGINGNVTIGTLARGLNREVVPVSIKGGLISSVLDRFHCNNYIWLGEPPRVVSLSLSVLQLELYFCLTLLGVRFASMYLQNIIL